jgi:flagellar hook-associated protein 2
MAFISGLASGLDTATIVNQLMQLEAVPQSRLQSRVVQEEAALGLLQSLNSKLSTLATKAEELANTESWSPLNAASSSEDVTVTANRGAASGSYTITPIRLARAHQLSFNDTAALDARVTAAGSTIAHLDLQDGEGPIAIDTGDGTLEGLVDALNARPEVQATTIKLDDGTYRLRVQARDTGVESNFTLTNEDGSAILGGTTVTAGQDAEVTIGGDTVTSSSNTFVDVIDGIDFTLSSAVELDTPFQLTVTRDSEALADDVESLVDSINGVLSQIDDLTGYDSGSQKAGAFLGDTLLRSLRGQIVNAIYPADGGSLAALGIELDRDGRFTFDAEAFAQAYEADPAGVTARFASGDVDGFAARIAGIADDASDSVDGTLTSAIQGRENSIERLEDSIADWDIRLEMRRQTLTRQFTALETALSQMQAQGQWLAGQLGSLPEMPTT